MFKGSFTALITPMRDGEVDEQAFRELVEWQITEGSHGLVPVGTTGESPTLTHAEHQQIVEWCVETAASRVPVMAGAGSNSTREAISLAEHGQRVGADALLVVCPYYNKPTQEGLYRHFKAVNDAVDLPIYIYNIPGRSVVDMDIDTMARLAELKNIAGVKDATADIARASQVRRKIGGAFNQLSGDDGSALGFLAHGGHGCISVTANVAPALCAQFQNAALSGDFESARKIQDQLIELHDALFIEASPAPTKYAVSLLGHCTDQTRLPIVPLQESTKLSVRTAMATAGLIFTEL